MLRSLIWIAIAAIGVWALDCAGVAVGQEVKMAVEAPKPIGPVSGYSPGATGYSPGPGGPGPHGMVPGKSEPGKPGSDPSKPPTEPGKPGDAKPAEKGAVTRPTKPPKPADPKELKVKPDKDGKLAFNFKNQPWQGILEWLAEISGMSLDWQDMPGDYLNLVTQQKYTVKEARDVINRHLLARGYTLLSDGEVLSVVSIKNINPAVVPRVEPADLAKRDPHEFVKVSFPLDWMLAEAAVEELKPMKSPNGTFTPMKGTNRLEAMDAVINLRQIQAVLKSEQSSTSREALVKSFPLQYTKPTEVVEQLETLLGIETKRPARKSSSGGPGMDPRMAMMMGQMGGQPQMQPQPGQPGQPGQGGPPKKPEIHFVVNDQTNSIIATAPPDKMALIEQAVKMLDVPNARSQSLPALLGRMQTYRLAGIDPEPLVETLEQLGGLDPSTKLIADRKNRAIIAYASLADHVMIRSLINKLDTSGRSFEVVPLRKLDAAEVAGTVEFMMIGEKPKQERRPRYYMFDPFGSSSRNEGEGSNDKFRVDADIEHNRLLLWANPIEMQEVSKLLVKLGEIPPENARPSTIRVVDLPAGKEGEELLQQIQRKWRRTAPNPLVLPPQKPEEKTSPAPMPAPKEEAKPPVPPGRETASAAAGLMRLANQPLVAQVAASAPAPAQKPETKPEEPAAKTQVPPAAAPAKPATPSVNEAPEAKTSGVPAQPPLDPSTASAAGQTLPPPLRRGGIGEPPPAAPAPITITRGPNGEITISSNDTQALDQLEDMIAQANVPSRDSYKHFPLKHAWASSVASILKDVFKEDDDGNKRRMPWYFYDDYGSQDQEKERARLSKKRSLKILSDTDTNSILVQGADASQLKKIEDLIKLYDRPEPVDTQSVRKTQTVRLQYAKAKSVADTIKDVFRDLLSSNDKALQGNQQQQPRERYFSFLWDDDNQAREMQLSRRYKGLLSIGVDEYSNSLILSASGHLIDDVVKMIEDLDEAARPVDSMAVIAVSPGLSPEKIEAVLSKLTGDGSKTTRSGAPGQNGPQQGRPEGGRGHNHNNAQPGQEGQGNRSPGQ